MAQTVRSCENNLGTPDEIFFDAQRDVVDDFNSFIPKCVHVVKTIKKLVFLRNIAVFEVLNA